MTTRLDGKVDGEINIWMGGQTGGSLIKGLVNSTHGCIGHEVMS